MLSIQNINKTFNRGSANEVAALKNVSLDIPPSQFVVLIGANGSGKSTLMNAVAGSIRIDNGEIFADGTDLTGLDEHKRSRWVARIFQNPLMGTAPGLTILENFRLAALRTGKKKLLIGTTENFKNKTREKIALLNLGLENKLNQPMGNLSGGERQALTLLMAVMDEAKIILLDEPAAALDPKTSELLMNLAEKIIREFSLTALLVTHRLKDVLRYGDRVILMKEGSIFKDLGKAEKSALRPEDIYGWF